MAYIQGVPRGQVIMFPECVDDYVGEENLVRFIDAFVDSLDLAGLAFVHSVPNDKGRPPYHPAGMLKLYVYGYVNRIRSSRCIEREARRNIEVMWLMQKLTPDFKTIADFRRDNGVAIKQVCIEFTVLCKRLGLLGGELVSVDSAKFRAVNSKKRNFNRAKLEKAIKEIGEKVEGYMAELEDNDKVEADLPCGDGEHIKEKIEALKRRGDDYQGLLAALKESGATQVSLTDPDSRAMVDNHHLEVCYSVQATVDARHKLIIDHKVTNIGTDENQLGEMAKRAKSILGVKELEVLADKGYYSAVDIKECVDNGITPYVPEPAPGLSKAANVPEVDYRKEDFKYNAVEDTYTCPLGSKLTFRGEKKDGGKVMRQYRTGDCPRCTVKGRCTRSRRGRVISRWEHEEVLEAMRKRVQGGKEKMKLRQQLSEHPFGTIKRGFNQGYLLLRGLGKVGTEASLSILAYNIKRTINILGTRHLVRAVSHAG